jgi:hypothetical protein
VNADAHDRCASTAGTTERRPHNRHALLEEAVFARSADVGLDALGLEFQDSNAGAETRIECSAPMAEFILTELRRLGTRSLDVELSFALTEAAVIVQRAINAHDGALDA